jgi:hypothetical protein
LVTGWYASRFERWWWHRHSRTGWMVRSQRPGRPLPLRT